VQCVTYLMFKRNGASESELNITLFHRVRKMAALGQSMMSTNYLFSNAAHLQLTVERVT